MTRGHEKDDTPIHYYSLYRHTESWLCSYPLGS
jgi:hypothetical protein